MRGMDLLNELSTATGLPEELIGEELSRVISSAGKTTDAVSLDELREMLAGYLQDVMLEAKDSLALGGQAHDEFVNVAQGLKNEPGAQAVVDFIEKKSAAENASAQSAEISAADNVVAIGSRLSTFTILQSIG